MAEAVGASAKGVAEEKGGASASSPPKDFVATLDVTEGSPCFGQIISEADVPTSGNEPHHVGLNQDATVSWLAGLRWRVVLAAGDMYAC